MSGSVCFSHVISISVGQRGNSIYGFILSLGIYNNPSPPSRIHGIHVHSTHVSHQQRSFEDFDSLQAFFIRSHLPDLALGVLVPKI